MSSFLSFAVVVAIIMIGLYVVSSMRATRVRSEPITGSGSQRGVIESAEAYKNHLAMARWIELQLKDDLVRSSVEEQEQARAKRLLEEFYGDDR